jgi:protease-4
MAGGRVFAQRTTLTGSIGSFIFKPVVLELLQRLGITTDSVSYGANYDLFSPYAPLSQQQQERLAALNEAFTTRFYRRVAESRGLPYEEVQSLGGGRIYSGERALELNLVDEIGGLWQALRYLEGDLGLEPDDYTLRYYPDQRTRVLLALQQLQQGLVRSLR